MANTIKRITVLYTSFPNTSPDCANVDAVDAPDAQYAQWRITGSSHNATQTREPPRQEEQTL